MKNDKKANKKTGTVILTAAMMLLALTVFLDQAMMTKKEVFQYVIENQEELLLFISSGSFTDQRSQRYKKFCVTAWNDTGMIQFETRSIGLGSASAYKGFYYVTDDDPVGFQGTAVEFSKQPPGLYWTDGTDNWMYVEKILPHWYWFEAYF